MKAILDDPTYDMSKAYHVPNAFKLVAERIRASQDDFMKSFLTQHENLIETRTDFDECAKNARRKRLIEMWKNQQYMEYLAAGGKKRASCGG